MERALLAAVARQPQIEIFENHLAIDLVTSQKLGYVGEQSLPGGLRVEQTNRRSGNVCGA